MPGSGGEPGGNKTYFPFFSDFRGHNVTALRVGESSALASIFLLALAGNVWGICLLVRQRQRLCAANCLVLNLFCADLLFITPIPFIVVVRWTESWVLGDAVCHMLFYVVGLSGTVIILSLSAVSLERVVSIARLRHAALRRRKVLAAALLLIWGFAALAALPLCCFFTVVRLPAAAGEVRAGAAGRARGSRAAGAGRWAPGQSVEGGSPAFAAAGRPLRGSGQRDGARRSGRSPPRGAPGRPAPAVALGSAAAPSRPAPPAGPPGGGGPRLGGSVFARSPPRRHSPPHPAKGPRAGFPAWWFETRTEGHPA